LADSTARAGDRDGAIEAYRRCLVLDPSDRLGAGARLALLGWGALPERLPAEHVRTLFDETADRFEESLLRRLEYRAPALLAAAIGQHLGELPRPLMALDIGCGTGLAGAALRLIADRLDGFDLSPVMVDLARRKGIYDAVWVADLLDPPDRADPRYGLVVAADMLCYLGDLAPAFAAVRRWLADAGWFAFTVEERSGTGYMLGPEQRFRHAEAAVRSWLAGAGFEIASLEHAALRLERREPVAGLVVVARQSS
jgi:predicted TPR repeat methyltransferase